MSKFREITEDRKTMSGIYAITLVTALLILAVVVKGPEESGKLIVDSEGNVTGISRNSMKRAERYELSLEVNDREEPVERDVSLNLQADSGSRELSISASDDRAAAINAGIDSVISEIEYSKKKKIILPAALPDGTEITWHSRENRGSSSLMLIIPGMYLFLVGAVVFSKLKEDNTEDEDRQSIMRGLPRFCNQLFLMMNAGLILSDAFDTITGSYAGYDEKSLTGFEKDLVALNEATDQHRISTAHVINEYAARHDVKEMIRIAAILRENEKRGSDVVESLARESKYLWEERKVVAREAGKMIDTRMSYPLGLLLILLIVITMAPALLNI